MNEKQTIKEAVKKLYCSDNLEGWETSTDLFYYFIDKKFKEYESLVTLIDENEFKSSPNDVLFNGEYTKKRVQNLIHIIDNSCRLILQECYKGDLYSAYSHLYNLLSGQKKVNRYLREPYINYFFFYKHKPQIFFRLREEKVGVEVQDCLHVPYNKREEAHQNRFSIQGLPCLYLSDSPETALAESATENKNNVRWIGEFTEKPGKNIEFMDLRLTSIEEIDEISDYGKMTFLITYPIRLMCAFKTKHDKEKAHDEYMIPQLLSHIVLINLKENRNQKIDYGCDGFVYDSRKKEGGLNFIMPARYKSKEPPTHGHSEIIKGIFDMKKPYTV